MTAAKLQRLRVPVLSIEHPSPTLTLLRIGRPAQFEFEAGQWCYTWLEGAPEEYKRAYSIASPPFERDHLEFCVKRVPGGPLSGQLYEAKPGGFVEVSLPLGSFHFQSPPDHPVVFLATGTGIAPLRSMIHDRLRQGDRRRMHLILGSNEQANLPYHDEFIALAKQHANLTYVPVLSRAPLEWEGDRGWIQEALDRRLHSDHSYHAYLCGLKRMVDDVTLFLQRRGIPAEAIHFERYT